MAEPAGKRTGLNKTTWALIAGGTLAAVLIVKRLRSSSSSTGASTALTGGTSIPAPSGTSPVSAPLNTLGQWIDAGLSSGTTATYNAGALSNDITSWLNGGCVTTGGYNVISSLLESNGLPPGYASAPTLSVCPDATTTTGTAGTSGTPTAGANATAAAANSVIDPGQLESILDQEVGALSARLGINATSQQLLAAQQQGEAQGLSGIPLSFFEQTQNVGAVSSHLNTPTSAQIQQQAQALAGGAAAYQALPSLQAQQYAELANVQLLQQLNH